MKFAPEVETFLNAAPNEPLDFLPVEQQRQLHRHLSELNYLRFGERAEPGPLITEHTVPVSGGRTVRVRAYRPGVWPSLPAHIALHGGAWWLGSIDESVNDAVCRYRCVYADCVVFAVEYRLAPEHKFPTAIEDAYSALCWISDHAVQLGVNGERLSIGGTSSGANIAAAVTQLTRDRAGPPLVFQLLEVPALDLTGESFEATLRSDDFESINQHAEDLERYLNDFNTGLRRYLNEPDDALLPLASPLRSADLSRLPPAHIMTAQFDPLREEGERYARALTAAGVLATVTRRAGAIHAMDYLTRVWPAAKEWQQEAVAALWHALNGAA